MKNYKVGRVLSCAQAVMKRKKQWKGNAGQEVSSLNSIPGLQSVFNPQSADSSVFNPQTTDSFLGFLSVFPGSSTNVFGHMC